MSLAQLSQLLPLPNEELQQVLDYAASLSKPEAASHFSNLLGDSPQAVDFISSFNSRRKDPTTATASSSAAASVPASSSNTADAVPKSRRKPKKSAQAIHTPRPRQVADYAAPSGTVYNKKDSDLEYMPQHQRASAPSSNNASRSSTPKPAPKERPSAGYLISDHSAKSKSKSTPSSRSSTPKPAGGSTKISISGGTPMAGQSTALADLDLAIRALEITTNPSLDKPGARKCNCVATRHPLQGAAPNCLSCGKVICMKEGLGPCTFCGTPLLSSNDVQAMMKELKEERGRERMAADAKANRRADVSKTPAPFTKPRGNDGPTLSEAEAKAREHRDKLLGFQAQNARRTTVRDEAADFDVSGAMAGNGGSMWASPEERARELKRQQKLMREMEWNARPEYEKRQQVVSIDLVGGKVVRKMAAVERPRSPDENDDVADAGHAVLAESKGNKDRTGGAFSGNPLLGSLIKPVFDAKGKGVEAEGRRPKKTGWRRVQDDLENNEGVILDGGVYGYGAAGDEPGCG
ncbi:hypothetical protein ACO1O0_004798 [Amphichorda felina]